MTSKHEGLTFSFPASSSDRWTNDNIIHGVIEEATYGRNFTGTVVDIGANIGAFSCLAAKTADHVYAYEPSKLNFTFLETNIAANGLKHKITARRVGLGNGEETLYTNPINCGAFSTFNHYSIPGETEKITCITLDEILEPLETVDWLKMDCEGAEWDGLFNCKTLGKVKNIVMELHFHDPKHVEADMVRFLEGSGFSVTTEKANVPTAVTLKATRV